MVTLVYIGVSDCTIPTFNINQTHGSSWELSCKLRCLLLVSTSVRMLNSCVSMANELLVRGVAMMLISAHLPGPLERFLRKLDVGIPAPSPVPSANLPTGVFIRTCMTWNCSVVRTVLSVFTWPRLPEWIFLCHGFVRYHTTGVLI